MNFFVENSYLAAENMCLLSRQKNPLFPGNLQILIATRHFCRLFRVLVKKWADEESFVSSIFTPKPMESKNIILRLFGMLPVLLTEAELPRKLMTNFPIKKAIGLTVSHYSPCLMRMEADEHWNTTGIFQSSACSDKSSLLLFVATPWRPRGALLGTVMVEREQGNPILMRE